MGGQPVAAAIRAAACGLALAVLAAVGPAAAADCRPVRLVELAVTPMGNVPTVTLRVDGAPATFLFDTGAERTVLTTDAAKRLRLSAHYEYARQMRSLGGAMSSGDARLASLGSGGLAMTNFRVLVGPISLPPVAGKPLDGLLGADFFTGFEVDLDLAHHRIILYEPPPCPIAAPDWSAPYATIAANRSLHDRLFFPVNLDGRPLAALIDTGAQLTTLDAEIGGRRRRHRDGAGARPGDHPARGGGRGGQVAGAPLRAARDRRRGAARPDDHGHQARAAGRRPGSRRRFPALAAGLALLPLAPDLSRTPFLRPAQPGSPQPQRGSERANAV